MSPLPPPPGAPGAARSKVPPGMPPKRKIVVIDPKFQWGMVAVFAGIAILSDLYLWFMFRGVFSDIRAAATLMSLEPDSAIFTKLQQGQESSTVLAIGTCVFVFFVISSIAILVSHRIVGPVYRLRTHLEAVADGRTTQDVKFRDKDYFRDLEAAANRVMAAIRAGRFK